MGARATLRDVAKLAGAHPTTASRALNRETRPLIVSRLNSFIEPVDLKEGMVFALETYCPASDGYCAARIEEEIVVASDGPRILTLFPAQELFVANEY